MTKKQEDKQRNLTVAHHLCGQVKIKLCKWNNLWEEVLSIKRCQNQFLRSRELKFAIFNYFSVFTLASTAAYTTTKGMSFISAKVSTTAFFDIHFTYFHYCSVTPSLPAAVRPMQMTRNFTWLCRLAAIHMMFLHFSIVWTLFIIIIIIIRFVKRQNVKRLPWR